MKKEEKQVVPGVVFASRQLNLDLDAGRRWTERAIAEYEHKKRRSRTAAAIAAHMNVAVIGRIAREEDEEAKGEARPAVNVAAVGAAAVKKAV